jgi:tetratricopeptide (TPR) repeat protein
VTRGDRDRTRERDQLREKLLEENCTTEQIAAAMARQFGDRPRPAWRHAYGWTQKDVAALYNQEINDTQGSMTANRISDFEQWPMGRARIKPTVLVLGVLAKVYSTKVSSLVDHHDRRKMSNAELIFLAADDSGVVPRQLLSVIPNFVGRIRELDLLTARLGRTKKGAGTVVITSINGAAGIGKTTLALHWARAHMDQFSDGQLYVDLRGFSPSGTPVTPQEAIRGFLNSFGVPLEKIPSSLDDQAALYRTLVEGKRLVIVLDNARDADQVWLLLPGSPTCLVLVTSRQQLGGLIVRNQAAHITLDFMTDAEARQLLATFLGSERVHSAPDEAVDELIQYCGGLPLALSIAAARILMEPHLPLNVLVTRLREQCQRLDALATGDSQLTDIRAVLSWSYTALTPQAARLFRLLGVHPGPDMSTLAIASLAGLSGQDTHTLLTELTRAHLVKQHIPGRYQFHDLIHLYATELATREEPEPQQRAALHRLLDHYLHTAYAATLLIYPRPPITLNPLSSGVIPEKLADYGAALAWFETERAVLVTVVESANEAGFTTHAWQLPWTFAAPFYRLGYWHDFAATQYTALAAAQRLEDQYGQAHSHHDLGDVCTWLTRFDESYTHHQQSLAIFSELNDKVGQADAHVGLAWVFAQQCHYSQASNYAQQAIDLYHAGGYQVGQANALNLLGSCHSELGNHQQALVSCQQALALQREVEDRHGEAGALHNIGSAHYYLGHHTEAITYYEQALALKRQLSDRYFEACTLTSLGDVHYTTKNFAAARENWQQSLTIIDQLGHPDADTLRARLATLDNDPDTGVTSN